jgi:hypothetical protein
MESGLNSVAFSGVAEVAVIAAPEVGDTSILAPLSEKVVMTEEHIVWDGQGNLEVGSNVQMAGVGNGARSSHLSNHFDFFSDHVLRGSHIGNVSAQAVAKVDWSGIADYTRNSLVDTKAVSNSLPSVLNCRESLCRQIAPNIAVSPWIFDMTSLYAIGWYMFFHQMKWTRRDEVPLPAPLNLGAVVFRNLNPPVAQEDQLADMKKVDRSEGRIVFLAIGSKLTPTDILLIMKLATGMPSLWLMPHFKLIL